MKNSNKKHPISVRVPLLVAGLFIPLLLAGKASAAQQRRIVYQSSDSGNSEIYTMNIDGTDIVRLTNDSSEDQYATWSPDGSRIAFVSNRSGNNEVYTMKNDGTDVINISNTPNDDEVLPVYSPDGEKMLWASSNSQTQNKFVVASADGSDKYTIDNFSYSANGTTFMPAWSPDSSKVFFVRGVSGTFQIFKVNPDGNAEQQLTSSTGDKWALSVSPDSSKVFFAHSDNDISGLSVINIDGSSEQSLVSSTNLLPSLSAWSPDSSKVFFAASETAINENLDLYSVSSSGSTPTKITNVQDVDSGIGVAVFNMVDSQNIIYWAADPTQNSSAIQIYKLLSTGGTATKLSNSTSGSAFWLNAISSGTVDTNSTPPQTAPSPPKTGKLIGATIATVCLVSIILLLAKEIKDKHHSWGSEK